MLGNRRCLRRRKTGSLMIQAVGVGTIIILIAMALIDLIVMVLANGVNDAAAKNAARAAASQPTLGQAVAAARNSIQENKPSGFIRSLTLQSVDYDPKNIVSCKTKIEITLPIPVPIVGGNYVFMAQATEPIVAR